VDESRDSIDLVIRERLAGRLNRRDFMRRAVLLGLAVPSAAALLAACTTAPTAAPTAAATGAATASATAAATGAATASATAVAAGKLRFWKAPHSDKDQTWWPTELQKFTAQTGTGVEYRLTPWDAWLETYTSGFSSAEPPDVSYFVAIYMKRFVASGHLLDLSKIPGVDIAKVKALYPESVWKVFETNGAVYGIPFLTVPGNLVWNKKHFEEAGLDPEVGPKDWEELRTFAKKLAKPGEGRWAYGSIDDWNDSLNIVPNSIINYGGDLTNADDTEWIASGPDYAAGLEAQRVLFVDDKTAAPMTTWVGQEIYKAFLDGKISMIQALPFWIVPLLKDPKYADFRLGISAPISGPKNNQSIYSAGYWSVASATKDPAAAWSLIEFVGSLDIVNPYMALTGLFPARTDSSPFGDDPIMAEFNKKQGPFARMPLLTISYWQTFMDETTAAFIGQKSSAQALEDAAKAINAAIKAAS
jgi:multiple sugar transport system substrate-binding protein